MINKFKSEFNGRNLIADIIRGIAILMVVLGHTMIACSENSEKSFLYNIIWSLQMPLFFLISGYVTRYNRMLTSTKGLLIYVRRRTISYLMPWAIWTFVVRGFIFDQKRYFNLETLLWNMDTGYWFLVTIWTISLIFGVSHFYAKKIITRAENVKKIKLIILTGVFYIIGMIALAGIGVIAGMSFLCIKYTLYYMPFFYAGYIFGALQEDIYSLKTGKQIIDIIVTVALCVWLIIVTRVNIYNLSDNGFEILLRAVASLSGSVAVCGLCAGLFGNMKYNGRVFCWFGIHSLEIYTIHYLLLNMIQKSILPEFQSLEGLCLVTINFCVTIIIAVAVILLLNTNSIIRRVLFGK